MGSAEPRGKTTQNSTLTVSFLFIISLTSSSAVRSKKPSFIFPLTRDGAVDSLISRHPHHIVAAACVYLCACVRRVHNLSIYVCVSVCVRESTAQDAVHLSVFQPPVHTHTPHHRPQITSRIWILGKAQDLQKVPTVGGCLITSSRLDKNALSFVKKQ